MTVAPGTREPAVSGAFYDADPRRLRDEVIGCYRHPVGPGRLPQPWGDRPLRALIVPHAALPYSGPVAAHAFLRLAGGPRPGAVIVVGPDHAGRGAPLAVTPHERWKTPLGEVQTADPLKDALIAAGLASDARGHRDEHAVEVQLPFLQMLGFDGPVVPITMADQDAQTARRLAAVLVEAVSGRDVVLIASTDLSHYLSYDQTLRLDAVVLEALADNDPDRLVDAVADAGVTMCGPGPVAAVLAAARRLGGEGVEVLCHATSGDTGGPRDRVVGYLAAAVAAS